MKDILNIEIKNDTITTLDDIVYAHVSDLEGNPLDLKLSITAAMGNSEMRAAMGWTPTGAQTETAIRHPVLIWFNGGGWRGVNKNNQLGELIYFARAGYTVVCVYYRSSAEGHFPDNITDCKTAVRFLRAHAEEYKLDPDRIAVMGRSAGGHLAVSVALNDGRYEGDEWNGYSSDVQAAVDMFGPCDIYDQLNIHLEEEKAGSLINGRWKTIFDTHEGAVLGGERQTLPERAREFSPALNLTETCAPLLILHGDDDPLVSSGYSEKMYEDLCAMGKGDQTDLYIITGAGHGTPEFFQDETKQIILDFLNNHM